MSCADHALRVACDLTLQAPLATAPKGTGPAAIAPPAETSKLPGPYTLFQLLELELLHLDMKIAGISPAELPPDLGRQFISYLEVRDFHASRARLFGSVLKISGQ